MRLLQRSRAREVEERRTVGYQGSSAMPHKQNPTTSERLCGLARPLRRYAGMMLENVALWHERDLSHSPVERVVLPGSMITAHYIERKKTYRTVQAAADRTIEPGDELGTMLNNKGIDLCPLRPERFPHHDVLLSRLEALHDMED
jgi:adenylosuccinate lyase